EGRGTRQRIDHTGGDRIPVVAGFGCRLPSVHWLRCVVAEWQLLRSRLVRSRLGIWLLLLGAAGVWLAARGGPLTVLAPHVAMLGAVLGVAFTAASDGDRAALSLILTHPTTPLAVATGRRRAGLGAAARRVAVCGAGPRRSGGMAPRNVLGGRWRRRHRAAVVTAGDVNTPVLLVRGVTRRRRGAAAPVADASLELAAGEV